MRRGFIATLRLSTIFALLLAAVPAVAMAQEGPPPPPEGAEVVAAGLAGPMGVIVDPDGNIWVITSGTGGETEVEGMGSDGAPMIALMGNSAEIIKIDAATGEQTVVATMPSVVAGEETEGGNRLALLDGKLYATGIGWHPALIPATAEEPFPGTGGVYEVGADGTVTEVAPLWQMERDEDPAAGEMDNHPYGVTAGSDGMLYVTDAGANALWKVDPATGETTTVAAFEPLEGVFPNPAYNNEMLRDAVPTAAVEMDGVWYVSLLTGAPFLPGTAKVIKIDADGVQSDFATGLTMLTDLQAGPDGNLYAVQFAMFGEQGPMPFSGAIVRVGEGDSSTVVVPGLLVPTSIAFNPDGDAFVTSLTGDVWKFAGFTAMEGMSMADYSTWVAEMSAAMAPPVDAAAAPAEGDAAAAAPAESTEAAAPAEADAGAAAPAESTEAAADAPAPETMPVTGGETALPGVLVAVLAVVAVVAGMALFGRRSAA